MSILWRSWRPKPDFDVYPAPPGQRLRVGLRNAREGEMEDFLANILRCSRDTGSLTAAEERKMAAMQKDPVLLVVQLTGGNDYLNTVVFPLAPALRSTDSATTAPADASAVGFPRFVRRLHCYYDEVRLLVSVHHRLWLLTFPMRTVPLTRR